MPLQTDRLYLYRYDRGLRQWVAEPCTRRGSVVEVDPEGHALVVPAPIWSVPLSREEV